MRYVIISPVRDEEKYIAATMQSVLAQTVRPDEWIIVNDGSKDRTGEIVSAYTRANPWIRLVDRTDRGFRQSGAGVVEAFYEGFRLISQNNWDFVVKLDGDMSFPADYFETLFRRFDADPMLGIAGGTLFHMIAGRQTIEKCPQFHVRGATKIYRRVCWEAIGGLIKAPGWDIVDETKASMFGWRTETFSDLLVHHHRVTGTAESPWRNAIKNGRACYFAGYHPLFMGAKCLYRFFRRPYVVESLGLAQGFLGAYFERAPQVNDPDLIRYVRRAQMARLWRRETIWR